MTVVLLVAYVAALFAFPFAIAGVITWAENRAARRNPDGTAGDLLADQPVAVLSPTAVRDRLEGIYL